MADVKERWAAIESNPEVLTELCHRLGASDQFEVGSQACCCSVEQLYPTFERSLALSCVRSDRPFVYFALSQKTKFE